MELLDKILSNLTSAWNVLPKDVPALIIQRGSGQYNNVTIETEQLHFHDGVYLPNMPLCQTVYLDGEDGYTIRELAQVINSMGYVATLASEDPNSDNSYDNRRAYCLIEASNIPLSPAVLTVFTSTLWKTLYPIARSIDKWAKSMDDALPQMFASITSGRWADYWATFFQVQRAPGESDESVRKRIFMNLANIKTNNVALAELIAFSIKGGVTVKDLGAASFEVDIDPSFMNSSGTVHSLIDQTKAGGVKYAINYTGTYVEDVKAHFKDVNQKDFQSSDSPLSSGGFVTSEIEPYGFLQQNNSLTIGRDPIGVNGASVRQIASPRTLIDDVTMVFTLNGTVTKSYP